MHFFFFSSPSMVDLNRASIGILITLVPSTIACMFAELIFVFPVPLSGMFWWIMLANLFLLH